MQAVTPHARDPLARILVADDHDDTRDMLATLLGRAGHEVTLAIDGDQALRLYRRDPPDVVLLDIFMPLKDGLETLMELRDEFPNARVIAMSAGWQSRPLGAIGAPPDVLHQADVLGADLTIAKPIEPAALLAAIATALTLRR